MTASNLALDALRLGVPRHGGFTEVRLVRHVAGQRRMMAENRVLHHRLSRAYRLEVIPQVRFFLIPGNTSIGNALHGSLLARGDIVLSMPFLEIFLAHRAGKARSVIAWAGIHARLRSVGETELGQLQDAFRALETIDFRSLRA